jgi:hypothetical protein
MREKAKKDKEEMAEETTVHPAPGGEAERQAWEEAKKQGLRGIDAYLRRKFDVPENKRIHPLFCAASHGFLEGVKHLTTKRNLCPYRQKDIDCALRLAAQSGHLPVVQHLIEERKGDPNTSDQEGYTALLMTAQSGHLPIVRYLIKKYGPRLLEATAKDSGRSLNAMHLAAQSGNLGLVQYLSSLPPFDHTAGTDNTPLGFAISGGHAAVAAFLIKEMGCNPVGEESSLRNYARIRESIEKCAPRLLASMRGNGIAPKSLPPEYLDFYQRCDEKTDAFFTADHLQSLHKDYRERQQALAIAAADEKIGAKEEDLPNDIAALLAGYAGPVEGEAALKSFSDFTAFVRSKMTHLPYDILNPLLALLNAGKVDDAIHAAKFLGRVILNRPHLISLDELKKGIYFYKINYPPSPFLDALNASAKDLEEIGKREAETSASSSPRFFGRTWGGPRTPSLHPSDNARAVQAAATVTEISIGAMACKFMRGN